MAKNKKKKKNSMSAELRPEFVVIDVDISGEQSIDGTALEIMESLKDCVSKDLFELLKAGWMKCGERRIRRSCISQDRSFRTRRLKWRRVTIGCILISANTKLRTI